MTDALWNYKVCNNRVCHLKSGNSIFSPQVTSKRQISFMWCFNTIPLWDCHFEFLPQPGGLINSKRHRVNLRTICTFLVGVSGGINITSLSMPWCKAYAIIESNTSEEWDKFFTLWKWEVNIHNGKTSLLQKQWLCSWEDITDYGD